MLGMFRPPESLNSAPIERLTPSMACSSNEESIDGVTRQIRALFNDSGGRNMPRVFAAFTGFWPTVRRGRGLRWRSVRCSLLRQHRAALRSGSVTTLSRCRRCRRPCPARGLPVFIVSSHNCFLSAIRRRCYLSLSCTPGPVRGLRQIGVRYVLRRRAPRVRAKAGRGAPSSHCPGCGREAGRVHDGRAGRSLKPFRTDG